MNERLQNNERERYIERINIRQKEAIQLVGKSASACQLTLFKRRDLEIKIMMKSELEIENPT